MKFNAEQILKHGAAAVAAAATLVLTGCGVGTGSQNVSPVSLAKITGSVHGGQQPVIGAQVRLLAVGTSGYGSGNNANPIITNGQGYVVTDAGGNFSITNAYSCPSNSQVYLVATGGNPGLAAGTNNGSLQLLAGLGSCSALTASTNININEVSTAAMVYALSGFMSNYVQVSTSSSNIPGIARAFAAIPNMINIASGTPLLTTPAGNGGIPVAEINTLADVIAPCVNSTGSGTSCNALFSATTPAGGSAPSNTVNALLNIAQNPQMNVANIYSLVTPTSPFQPTLTSAPNDWSLAINYTGSGMSQPFGLTIDTSGSVYVSNPGNNSVSELSFLGAPMQNFSNSGTFSMPMGVTSDVMGNILVANFGNDTLARISNGGLISTFTGGGLSGPFAVAIDGNQAVYAANNKGNSISVFTSNGTPNRAAAYTGGGVNAPTGISVDTAGEIFTVNSGNNSISKFLTNGTFASPDNTGYTGGGLSQPVGLAFDAGSNLYAPNASSTVSYFKSNGSPVSANPITGGGTGAQGGVAVDGDGNAYVSLGSNGIKVILVNGAPNKSPSNGFQGGGLNGPARLALDISGNLWVANNGSGSTSVTEFIGFGAPTVTPLSLAVQNGTQGMRP